MPDSNIAVLPNGPYLVKGDLQLVDHDGKVIEMPPGARVALCRCGASKKKPFCDGSHGRIGFRDRP